jgi:hypothetical protein
MIPNFYSLAAIISKQMSMTGNIVVEKLVRVARPITMLQRITSTYQI